MLNGREESWAKDGYSELDRLKRLRISGHNDFFSEEVAAVNRLRLSLAAGMDAVELEGLQAATDALYGVLERKLRRKRAQVEAGEDNKAVDKSVWRSL